MKCIHDIQVRDSEESVSETIKFLDDKSKDGWDNYWIEVKGNRKTWYYFKKVI